MTDQEVIAETENWIARLKVLSTETEHKDHVIKHIEILERLVEIAGDRNKRAGA